MQQDPVYTQTHSRTHRLGGDGGLACNRIHPPPPPLQPHPYTHTHTRTFMLTRGKRKSLRLISGASAPTSERPNKVTVGGDGERSGPPRHRQHEGEPRGGCVGRGRRRKGSGGRQWGENRGQGRRKRLLPGNDGCWMRKSKQENRAELSNAQHSPNL